ncbi:MAG: hypothetical protein EAX90_03660 [Candidatus Heimdallarchaeota archaeon]|nr:hypothetical protein [Candidatus Heimdallarchaeota archaeon]
MNIRKKKAKSSFITIIILISCIVSINFSSRASTSDEILTENSTMDYSYQKNDILNNIPKNIYDKQLFTSLTSRSGPQRFAVICVKFADRPSTRWTIPEMEDIMDLLNVFWINASYGAISIEYQVEGWYDLPYNFADYGDTVDRWAVMHKAIELADTAIDFRQFGFVMVWIGWEGEGGGTVGQIAGINTDEGSFNVGLSIIGENAIDGWYSWVWGTAAHEMGHNFGLEHTHFDYESEYGLMARAYPSALSIYSQCFEDATGWFDTSSNQIIYEKGQAGETVVRPRYLDLIGDTQSIKIEISESKYYMIEVIKLKDEDSLRPDEGVYIYLVDKAKEDDRECVDMDAEPSTVIPDDLWDVLFKVGDTFTDTGNSITIEVIEQIGDGYKIGITNGAAGAPNLKITAWGDPEGSPPPYETPDIWVDSMLNGWDYYRYRYGTTPIGIGDDPWANHENRLYARIHNVGETDALGVTVKFYENIPIGAGASGTWNLIDTKVINVDADDEEEVFVIWTPNVILPPGEEGLMDIHSCIQVKISSFTGETDLSNNEAMENIDYFDIIPDASPIQIKSTPPSGFASINATFRVRNPHSENSLIYVNIIGLNKLWTLEGNGIGEFHNFSALEEKDFEIKLTPGPDVNFGERIEAHLIMYESRIDYRTNPQIASKEVEEWHLVPIGGLTLTAGTMFRSNIELQCETIDDEIEISGKLTSPDGISILFPEQQDNTLLIEIIDDSDVSTYLLTVMNDNGEYNYSYVYPKSGNYSICVYYAGSNILTTTKSSTIIIDTSTSTTTKGFPGAEFSVAFSVIIITIIVSKIKKNKK